MAHKDDDLQWETGAYRGMPSHGGLDGNFVGNYSPRSEGRVLDACDASTGLRERAHCVREKSLSVRFNILA